MKLLALIPARGGSKGIPRKNIKLLAGKPLLGWSFDAAKSVKFVDRIVVSTDDEEIANVARSLGAEVPFIRPAEYSDDKAAGILPVLHALDQLPQYDWVLLLQPTSPLRSKEDIEGIVQLCIEEGAPSAVSISKVDKHPYWMYQRNDLKRLVPIVSHGTEIASRQDLPVTYSLNGALYLANREWLLSHKTLIGQDTVGYVMPPERSVDIDTINDWRWAEYLIEQKNG